MSRELPALPMRSTVIYVLGTPEREAPFSCSLTQSIVHTPSTHNQVILKLLSALASNEILTSKSTAKTEVCLSRKRDTRPLQTNVFNAACFKLNDNVYIT